MKRSREPEESSPSSPPSLGPDLDIGDETCSAAQLRPAPYSHGAERTLDQPRAKIVGLSPDGESDNDDSIIAGEGREQAGSAAMSCRLHRERMDFPTYDTYEAHYAKEHLNRCIECRRNFPSPLYLRLHGDEWHNPFVAVKRDKGEHTYACFVEGCERKCGSSDKRRRHLIDKHSFPHNFFFSITQYGIDGRQSLLVDDGRRQHHHRRQSSTGTVTKKDVVRRRTASINMTGTGAASPSAAAPNPASGGTEDDDDDSDAKDEGKPLPKGHGTKVAAERDRRSQGAPKAMPKDMPDVDMEDLTGAMSSMTFIPRSVRFGRGGRSGFVRR
ncbi:c2h2 type zinc finger domain containing protein [Sporothrix schenckii 1099-18]|uniref:C2h2 type zinc finger domain containing protein n=1 Tax=Sporothrix schenckii 1099-18 TaxID=1397361 RepID=A0A0F2LZP4_SPOSC|nr:c2h2 type zinc finger domain containing protein [Sporothrix schenckii 1099-18]KJR82309.1 c2h2 type zinc finger domain containing protein [Sporothrix schenckii 1099-18]